VRVNTSLLIGSNGTGDGDNMNQQERNANDKQRRIDALHHSSQRVE
jgi:hypothetical protein